jgi:hypothetical protein
MKSKKEEKRGVNNLKSEERIEYPKRRKILRNRRQRRRIKTFLKRTSPL